MRRRWMLLVAALALAGVVLCATSYESYSSLYDAEYIGSAACGTCHTQVYADWKKSPHAKMTEPATPARVLGDFSGRPWLLEGQPVARTWREGDDFFMSLLEPKTGKLVPFKVDYAIGYQFRQTYLTREEGGVLRRLPLEWSVEKQEFFPYWNFQEGTRTTLPDLWEQTKTLHSAWNLFCARCHTTHLEVAEKDEGHTRAVTRWTEDGIACEACHGPGSHHRNYFARNYVNRFAAFLNGRVRGQPAAYIATGAKLTKGQDLSVCARCHGPDIQMATTDVYRDYEPGYSRKGRINDLSAHFKEVPLEPGRSHPATVECWGDGRPRGIAMLFRSFVESACYEKGNVRCTDCHDPHDNKRARQPGLLEAGPASDAWCLRCHGALAADPAAHTRHAAGTSGSFCYDCHMPRHIQNLATGVNRPVRTHWMSEVPRPEVSERLGLDQAPNACNDCHRDRTPAWASGWVRKWWPRR
jgi:predicted CXXCH cytochrome family protein